MKWCLITGDTQYLGGGTAAMAIKDDDGFSGLDAENLGEMARFVTG